MKQEFLLAPLKIQLLQILFSLTNFIEKFQEIENL